MTEVQRLADLQDEVAALREGGQQAQAGLLLIQEAERQLHYLRADLARERGLPVARQSADRLRAAEDALARQNAHWQALWDRYRGPIVDLVVEEQRAGREQVRPAFRASEQLPLF